MARWIASLLIGCVIIVGALLVYRTYALNEPVVKLDDLSLKIEFATTPAAREKGLSGRESIPEDSGMLLVFPKSERYGIWMKDMLVPIDIFWLDDKGQVISIASDVAASSFPNVFYPALPTHYVLETAAGFARMYGVATGTLFSLKNLPNVSQ
ncbi:DUF192 domain-containing protein [Candidatus Kaiserbacteria bacterium]|nr:DUF192 domain-containing protein [Candidatus Kaiserbacteria bacterium]